MAETPRSELSSEAKLVRVVLANCGPLSPSEVAEEAMVDVDTAAAGLEELAEAALAEPVCGVCAEREEVYALTEPDEPAEPSRSV